MLRNSLLSSFLKFSSLSSVQNKLFFENPYEKLKQYLEVPLLDDQFFSPDTESLVAAQELFVPTPLHPIGFITSGIGSEKFPVHDMPEVVFMGKSNAGKSSLLKAIFQHVPSLRIQTSKKPGHTKTAKFYQVGSKLCLVDMPGYGFRQPEWFESLVDEYFKRKNCVRTFLLIDGKLGFENIDQVALEVLESYKVPHAIVVTKIDQASDSTLLKHILQLKNIKKSTVYCFSQPFMVSSQTYEGLGHLLAFIGHITGNVDVKSTDINSISS
ncbi:GTP-binding protein 8 [Araneus ventricosus]|uniref:GTP-binding protein 8 n=1 Tax=Araneus ventricosus TaxID=182803 RepID=A0A4Y2RVN9_ARAVE|nr:GTP-binding protein 8 [Araneus ventricosus]